MQLADNEAVLEIGFGSGTFLNKLHQQADQLRVSGIDHSEEMVEQAKQANQHIASNLKVGNSNRLPFSDDSFDKVFCNMVVYFWEQPEEHLKEIRRVLKPNGRFYTGLRTKESMLQFPFVQYGFTLFDESQWKSVLDDNGFNVIHVEKQADPKLEMEDGEIQMESLCIVAENASA